MLTRLPSSISSDRKLSGRTLPVFSTLLTFLLLVFAQHAHCESTILNLLSSNNSTYHKVADLTSSLFSSGCQTEKCRGIIFKNSVNPVENEKHLLKISYGTKATALFIQHDDGTPKIRTMIPKQIADSDTVSKHSSDILDIYIDQPVSRYFSLIRTALPRSSRIGILVHESNQSMIEKYTSAASEAGLNVIIALVENNETGKSLSSILDDIDVLLALPDSRIHNSKTIPNILTTAYRNKIPVIGFSSAYTKAGAVASIFTSLDNIAKETAEAAIGIIEQESPPKQRTAAKYFSIAVNYDVARSLGLSISSEEIIRKSIK